MKIKRNLIQVCLLVMALLPALVSESATLVVTNTADSGAGSLRQMIASASPGDTVTFATNLSGATITLTSGQLVLNTNLTIDASALPGGVQINGNGASRIFNVANSAIVVLTALTILNGNDQTRLGGGGIFNSGGLSLNQCTVSGNYAPNALASGGGGIYNSSLLIINQCTITGNHSDGDTTVNSGGGGIYNGAGLLMVNQSTITGNHSDNDSGGAGGGGIYNGTGNQVIFNSIVAGNSAVNGSGADIYSGANINFAGANIIQNIHGNFSGNAPINAAPQLAPLGNYGGPTQTMPPLPGSPAININCVNSDNFTNDQRGVPQVPGGIADIGSVELAPPAVATLPATAVGNSNATLNATLNPNTLAATAWFQWGVTNNPYSNQTTPVVVAGGNTNTALAFSNNLAGLLTPGVVYHCRAFATNVDGSANGNNILFGSAPVVTLFGAVIMTNECHTAFTDPGAANSLGLTVVVTGNVNVNSPGTYLLIYTVTNSLGLAGTATRAVVVNDTQPPVITLLGDNPMAVLTNTPFVDPGATALDACGGGFGVTSSNNVNTAVLGSYTVTYSSTDSYGNTSTSTRTVLVRTPLIVITPHDNGIGSLRQIVSNSVSGDTVQFAGNLSGTTILLTNGEIDVNNNLTIDASALPGGIQISGNRKSAVFGVWSNTTVVLTSLIITNGYRFEGAGIFNESGNVTVNQCTLGENTANEAGTILYGGAVYNTGTMVINQSTLIANGAGEGGAVYNAGTMVINQSTLIGNVAGEGGGAVWNAGTMVIKQSTLIGNLSQEGGAVLNYFPYSLTLDQCTLVGNKADTLGGGIADGGNLTLNECTLATNSGTNGGGGILEDGASLTINQCTIVGNSTQGQGGGIWIQEIFEPLTFINSIVAGNSATAGATADIDVTNNNDVYFDGANIVQSFSGIWSGAAFNTKAPQLAPLGNYGGPTQTMPPLPGSPAIDACTNGISFIITNLEYGYNSDLELIFTNVIEIFTNTTDQRGFPRLLSAFPDIGAVEGVYTTNGPGQLAGMKRLGNGSTQFTFTNYTDGSSTVLASTNVALPLNTWSNLGPAVESPVGSGQFQFTDPQAASYRQRFYRVRTP